jgi:hypothetical protein
VLGEHVYRCNAPRQRQRRENHEKDYSGGEDPPGKTTNCFPATMAASHGH